MKYVVKMRMTIIKEYDVVVGDVMVDNAVEAMNIAEDAMRNEAWIGDSWLTIRETEWSPVSVTTKESSD